MLAGAVAAAPPAFDPEGMDTTYNRDRRWPAALRPLLTPRGWTQVTHHLLGLPLGIAYFVWIVTGLSLGAGLAITLLGIPILTFVLANVRPLLMAERGLANALLGTRLPPLGITPRNRGSGLLGRLKAYWTDGMTWRGVLYLLLRFPVGVLTFTVAVAFYGAAVQGLAAPLLAPLDAIDLGFWEPDTVLEGLLLVPLGAVLLVAAGWVSEGMAAMSRALIRITVR
jgi:Putative sensor